MAKGLVACAPPALATTKRLLDETQAAPEPARRRGHQRGHPRLRRGPRGHPRLRREAAAALGGGLRDRTRNGKTAVKSSAARACTVPRRIYESPPGA